MGFQLFVFCIANIFSSFSSEFVHGPYLLELFILQVKKPTQKRRSIDWKSKVSSRLLCFNDWKNQGSFLLSTVYSSSKAVLNFTVLLVADCRFSRFQVTTPHCVETDFHGPSEMSEEPSVPDASPIWRPKFNYISFFLIRTNSWVYCLGQSDLYQSCWQRQQGYLGRLNQSVLTPRILE